MLKIAVTDFDIVFLDYNLGRINGKEILAEIKSKKNTIDVIMISGYIINNPTLRKLKNTLYSFHTKPLDFEIIRNELIDISQKNHLT